MHTVTHTYTTQINSKYVYFELLKAYNVSFQGVVLNDDFQLLAEDLSSRGLTITFRIPPSTRERARDVPMETLNHVIDFLDDVEMDVESLFPNPADGDIIMTIGDLFKQLEVDS